MTGWQSATAIAGSALATVGLLAGGFSYASRWPTSTLFGDAIIDLPDPDVGRHTVALTYDDGPSPRNTPELLDILAAAGVTATFFLIGNHVRRYPDLARRIVEGGHTVGNHTDMHPALARKNAERTLHELESCQSTIAGITGVRPAFFRPPYGSRRPATFRIARELGLQPVLWNITSRDWTMPGPAELERTVARGIAHNRRRGRTSNLLLHDGSHLDAQSPESRADTLSATRALLQRSDLRFVSIDTFA